jgi:DNA-binding IclR family transcriptional regulator
VLVAVRAGARTSTMVAAATGLTKKHCSAHLRELELGGLVRCDRKNRVRSGERQHLSNVYSPTDW